MELFLWLYFWDNRFFFNLKVPVRIYKYSWFVPLFVHSILIFVGVYYLDISSNFKCVESLKLWLYHRIVLSFLICLNMIIFMIKISQAYDRETAYFSKARQAYPILKDTIHEYDYWIRRNCLFSTSGVLLLIQGLISFFWSYMIAALYKDHYYDSCDTRVQQVLNAHSYFIWYGNVILLVILCSMVFIKLLFFGMAKIYPRIAIQMAVLVHKINSSTPKLKSYFRISNDGKNLDLTSKHDDMTI